MSSDIGNCREKIYITRALFCANYCINFFLYCLTGSYYRKEVASICGKKRSDSVRTSLTERSRAHSLRVIAIEKNGSISTKSKVHRNNYD